MHKLQIALTASAYRPGEKLQGRFSWELEKPVEGLELRIFWHTQGKGTRDIGMVARQPLASPHLQGWRDFTYELPDGPWSFSGTLITLSWVAEIVTVPGEQGEHVEFVLSPTGTELHLEKVR